MGTKVNQKERALKQIKDNASASNSVPALRDQVALLADEVQKLKDIALGKLKPSDD